MLKSGIIGVLVCGLVLVLSSAVMGSVTFKVGYNNYGYLDEAGTGNVVKSGYSLGVELANVDPANNFEWGCGLSLETENEIKNSTEKLHFNLVYVFCNYYLTEQDKNPYFTLRLGSDLERITASPYYGAGIGIDFSRKYQIEAVYSVNNSDDGNYARTCLNFGFRF